ncbi:hypothetical protein SKAU_G00061630 [Synaphobranchus kaupii]|uniref:Uncharacterized protein n=1 Tax=Synaphobranchus kaupii TaxID=118154 RepID=A0A9Q1G5V0_SYNKA|nr:hypothetical protein SKAU_G00061630 [Synaphobranchus kaupii]
MSASAFCFLQARELGTAYICQCCGAVRWTTGPGKGLNCWPHYPEYGDTSPSSGNHTVLWINQAAALVRRRKVLGVRFGRIGLQPPVGGWQTRAFIRCEQQSVCGGEHRRNVVSCQGWGLPGWAGQGRGVRSLGPWTGCSRLPSITPPREAVVRPLREVYGASWCHSGSAGAKAKAVWWEAGRQGTDPGARNCSRISREARRMRAQAGRAGTSSQSG